MLELKSYGAVKVEDTGHALIAWFTSPLFVDQTLGELARFDIHGVRDPQLDRTNGRSGWPMMAVRFQRTLEVEL